MNLSARLILDTVSIRYGLTLAVDNLSMLIGAGEIFGLLGPNGSGKSSTLGAIAGLIEPSTGSIRIEGIRRGDNPRVYAEKVGFVPQEPALYEELTVQDNLRFFGQLYDITGSILEDRIQSTLERVQLLDRAHDRVGTLSGGMQRRVNLATALLHQPAILLLDEPTVALDPPCREQLFQTLHDLREEGRTIVLTTHLLDEAEQWCDRVGILRKGQLLAVGCPSDVLRSYQAGVMIFGLLREDLPETTERAIRARLHPEVDLEIIGRRIKLVAPDGEQLGLALAVLGASGAELEAFRTPPPRLDRSGGVEESREMETLHAVTERGSCVAN